MAPTGAPSGRMYLHPSLPWQPAISQGSGLARQYYISLAGQAVRYGRPAARRFGTGVAMVARTRLPEAYLRVRARGGARARPDLEELLASLVASWGDLRWVEEMAPPKGEELTCLALERAIARTVFVFHRSSWPVLVAKLPRGDGSDALEREARLLERVEAVGVAPRYLGRTGGAWVQSGLAGAPRTPRPLVPEEAADLAWEDAHEGLAEVFSSLARATVGDRVDSDVIDTLRLAVADGGLTAQVSRRVEEALGMVTTMPSVLVHGDASMQNILHHRGAVSGLVDWEMGQRSGLLGMDLLSALIAEIEDRIGMRRWSWERATEAVCSAWDDAPLFVEGRAAIWRLGHGLGLDDRQVEASEIAVLALRLGQYLQREGATRGGVDAARGLLVHACGRG